jgi:restriction endonuclease S subunit
VPFAIPEKWKWLTIGEIIEKIIGGGTPSKACEEYWNGDIPWASVKDLKGDVLSITKDRITQSGFHNSSSNLIPKGTLIICVRMGLGKISINSIDVAINQDLKAIHVKDYLIDQKYFLYFYKSLSIKGSGSTVRGITTKDLLEMLIPMPPLEEQHRIVEKIKKLFEQIDSAEKAYNELSGPLSERFRQLCLEKAIQGKLVPQLESEPEAAQIGEVPAEIPFEVPKKWKWCRLKELTFPAKQKIPDKEFLYLDVSSIDQTTKSIKGFKKLNSSTAPSRARKSLKEGMVLFATVRPYLLNTVIFEGNKNNIEAIASTAFATFTCNEALLNIYIWLVLQSPYFFDYVSRSQRGVSYPAITDKQFFDAYIPLPPLKEQCRIVAKLNKLLSDVTKIESPVSTP